MLPDFPETKRLFSRFFRTYMRRKVREVSPYGAVQTRYLHEGRAMKITRADRSESTSSMEELSVHLEIKFDEIESLTLQKAIEKHDAMIADMVQKQTHFVRERLSSEIPESQTLNAKGRKFDAQVVIEMLEKMQIDFYPDGTPHEIFVDSPLFTPERMAAVDKEFESNPELKRKFDEMMEKKKEEWRAREADRKLVG
jgi:phenylalanine-4-hydroxylase